MTRRSLLPTLAASLVAVLAVACGSDPSGAAPEPAASGPDVAGGAERIEVAGGDALAWGAPGSDLGVVLAHGAAFDAVSWSAQATALADGGARVVAVEEVSTEALAGAADLLREEGAAEVALGGGSVGADAVLDLVAERPGVADRLALLSPNSPVDDLGGVPTLVVASEDEAVVDVARGLADAATSTEAVLLPGSAHAQNLFDSDQAGRAQELLLAGLTGTR